MPPDTSGVEVIGKAVAGPYSLEVITAGSGENLRNWLALNSYQISFRADAALQHYVDLGGAFLGVKLRPTAPAGPLDALVFTCPATNPSIPLILTGIATVADMELVAYVLGARRYRPGNYAEADVDHAAVMWTAPGQTDYLPVLRGALDRAGGRAFEVELASPTEKLLARQTEDDPADALLARGRYLTRMRTFLSPEEMTVDPWFGIAEQQEDVPNVHVITDPPPTLLAASTIPSAGGAALVALVALGLRLRPRLRERR